MKTFKLRKLVILDYDKGLEGTEVHLIDGLIINREDDHDTWLIEGFINRSYWNYFKDKLNEELMVQATITKDTNEPASFITKLTEMHEIGEQMNVMLMGKIIDKQKKDVEQLLTRLVEKGYEGENLIQKFKEVY
ncbi:YwpF-like family protein [Oceanobacillus jeddahense]|uniref:YwpF-like family protein n=1 Tax=Oceanobacillus jeddahense TaxID=1462527 RepID=A0ABY5JN15_9BACI|nr:YwpF family protein [Oceanobacillus jeddahense]UUI01695.1 YwpF-like family protein [Oceanobacillus jeddahense]